MSLDGPYFDDFVVGETLPPAPPITIGVGETALYQAIAGDPYTLALLATARAHGHRRPPTHRQPRARVCTSRSDRAPSPHGSVVRQPLLPRRDPAPTGESRRDTVDDGHSARAARDHAQGRPATARHGLARHPHRQRQRRCHRRLRTLRAHPISRSRSHGSRRRSRSIRTPARLRQLRALCPHRMESRATRRALRLAGRRSASRSDARLGHRCPGARAAHTESAAVHRDARLGQQGRRLVYGGHTIGLAQASLARLLPSLAHVIGWHSCDHVGPVFEDDVLSFSSELTATQPLGGGRLLAFRLLVHAERRGPRRAGARPRLAPGRLHALAGTPLCRGPLGPW